MKSKIYLIVSTLIFSIIAFIIGFYLTLAIDKAKGGEDVNIKVTYEDSETYIIPSVKKMTKDEALKEWPYIVHVENTGSDKGLFQIIIKDIDKSTIKRDDLDYILEEDKIEVSKGNLNTLKNNILFEGEIDGKEEKVYKLYIYTTKDFDVKDTYEYKLEFNAIKTGGPGF